MDRIKREGYGDDSFSHDNYNYDSYSHDSYSHNSYGHQREEKVASLIKKPKLWCGSSGFGLANILNCNSSAASSSTMPTFSLPSIHRYGKQSLLAKQERLMASQNYDEENQHVSTRQQHQQRSTDWTPARHSSPNSRRSALARASEEEADQETESTNTDTVGSIATQPIRGGRWTADEHERFLEGFCIHGHKWKRVQQVVRTRSVTQVRTHAQKYLLKVAKLKGEKKQIGKSVDMVTLSAELLSKQFAAESLDDGNTQLSAPEQGGCNDNPDETLRKKVRRLDHGNCDPVDQEYIAAAATTLCFLMSQKIDSLFDTRHEQHADTVKADYEPYDCYAPQPASQPDVEQSRTRKRPYMDFSTDQQDDFASSYDTAHDERLTYTIEGNNLCS
ncbi:unnamed protein product [Peronospora destructor]|uniref:Uncharacterized protein n=1 Tax=Peronospora destructor TaxID=86335 RepID=A0AAV0UMU6_9STRA|nr:unnamed protein product [Peronospora destructor]